MKKQILNEGFFSWKTSDTKKSISNKHSTKGALPVKMIDDKGNEWIETEYDGYGKFGGKSYYELAAEMNNIPTEKLNISDVHKDGTHLKLPKLVSVDCDIPYEKLPNPENCPEQGYFYGITMAEQIRRDLNLLNEAWETKKFKTKDEMNKWISKNKNDYEYEEIYINNAYGVEYRPLKKIDFDDEELNETAKPLGSINPYIRTHAKCNGKSFVFNGTTIDMVKQAINIGCKEGDVIVTEDDTKYKLKLAPHDDRADGYWADRIWNKNLKESETKSCKDYFIANESSKIRRDLNLLNEDTDIGDNGLLKLKFIKHDSGNARDYYRGICFIKSGEEKSRKNKIYCQQFNADGSVDESSGNSWFICSKDGEPESIINKLVKIEVEE